MAAERPPAEGLHRLVQLQLAVLVMAIIFFGGALWTGKDWARWVAIGLLVLGVLLRAYKRRDRS